MPNLQLEEKKLNLAKQECALKEKDFKILKLKSDIERVEHEIDIQKQSIEALRVEIKEME
jgi:hypothetical protein